jgi:ABC-type hemin transport system ATPase subunit
MAAGVRELGVTTLLAVHDLNLAASYCGRLYVMSAGRVMTSGPPACSVKDRAARSTTQQTTIYQIVACASDFCANISNLSGYI